MFVRISLEKDKLGEAYAPVINERFVQFQNIIEIAPKQVF